MPDTSRLRDVPNLPRDEDGPVFDEPWQAQAFAMAVKLHEGGHFTWSEWVDYLSAEIAASDRPVAADPNTTYYHQWLAALEKIVAAKGLSSSSELAARKGEWKAADRRRGFGKPLELHPHPSHGRE